MLDRKLRVFLCGMALLTMALASEAQQAVPDAPVPVAVLLTHMTDTRSSAEVRRESPAHVVDKKFIVLSVALMGLTISDLERTQHCLAQRTCVEMNPMLPHSRAGMYAVNVPINVGTMYLAYRMKAAGWKTWWIVPALNIAGHAVGTGVRF
jgi:hypothetical protein